MRIFDCLRKDKSIREMTKKAVNEINIQINCRVIKVVPISENELIVASERPKRGIKDPTIHQSTLRKREENID
jgi:hypothetical protein